MSRTAPPRQDNPADENAPTALGRSAKRLSTWATNLLATSIVLAAGLTFGRQVLLWWRDEGHAPPAPAVASPRPGEPAAPHRLEFGDVPFVFQREALAGDRRVVLARLVAGCRAIAEAGPRTPGEAGPAERALLARLSAQTPVADSGDYRVYQLDEPLPMAAAIRPAAASNGSGPRNRVVSWGLAMPIVDDAGASENQWTLFTWSAGHGLHASPGETPPLPPAAERTMLLSADDGSTLVGFRSDGPPRDAMNFYSEYFQRPDSDLVGNAVAPWREINGVWHARFHAARSGSIDVQLAMERDGALSGLLTISAPPPRTEE